MKFDRAVRLTGLLLLFLIVNTAYIAAIPSATIFYMGNVVLHLVLGAVLAVLVIRLLPHLRIAGSLFLIAAAAGLYLAVRGNTTPHRWVLQIHIALAAVALLAALPYILRNTSARFQKSYAACLLLLIAFPVAVRLYQNARPNENDRIRNPLTAPVSMNGEGGGRKSPFFPSSAQTNVGGIIPSNFFMDSERCGECHKDIYQQWKSSVHHFASFNNQFYRKSIEYVQSVVGTRPSKWCAGCHDHAVFFNGRFDRPIKEQVDTPEARAGLACTSCHSIVHVSSTMGNGDFTVQYPPLHDLASSRNPYIHA